MSLPDQVRKGVEALQKGKPDAAIAELEPVFDDPEFAAAEDLRDIRARVGSLLGQAWLLAGKPEKADRPLREAMRLAKALSDEAGVASIRRLQTQVIAQITERHQQSTEAQKLAKIAQQSLEELLSGVTDVEMQLDLLIRKSIAEIEHGRPASGADIASQALQLARSHGRIREQVLSHMSLARAVPTKASIELQLALEIAATAGEFNLVGGIVKASEIAGITLPSQPFAGRDPS